MVELPRCSQCSGFFIRCANHNITSLHQEKIFKDLEKENERLEKVVRGLEQGDYQRSLINENQTLKSRVGLREMEIGELKSQIRALENQLTEQESNNFSQEDRKTIAQLFGITSFTSLSFIGRVEEEKGKLERKIKDLEQQLREANVKVARHDSIQSEFGDWSKKRDKAKNELKTLQVQLTKIETSIQEKTADYEKFMELEDKVEELEEKLAGVKRKLATWVKLIGGRGVKAESKKGWFW